LNLAYGFCDELSKKYSLSNANIIKDALSRFYMSLPLCCWVPHIKKTFISHGGPPLTVVNSNKNDIGAINRHLCKRTIKSNEILENLLWSDPDRSQIGITANTSRGAGLIVGIDAIESWMTKNDVETMIRSHQCVQFGHELLRMENESRECYTVFSSADYRGAGNEGAVIVLSKLKGIQPESFHPDDVIRDDMLKIDSDPHCHHKYSKDVIRAIFKALDVDNHGYLTLNDLESGLNHTKQFKLSHDLEHSCIVGDKIISLQDIFNEMDKDHNGRINIDEFVSAFLSA